MNNQIYEKITDQIIKQLEDNNLTWLKSWSGGIPQNLISKKNYRGINSFLINIHMNTYGFKEPYYLTFKQIKDKKGFVKKGSKGVSIVYYKTLEKPTGRYDNDNKEIIKKIPLLRYYYVFNIEQTQNIEIPKRDLLNFNPIKECEMIKECYKDKPEIRHKESRAYYNITEDFINMPDKQFFNSEPEYYSTLFHEFIHSTGSVNRLKRDMAGVIGKSDSYSKEEIIAELGNSYLCGVAGIENKTLKNSSAYIQSWLKQLRQDSKFIFKVMTQSQKATDYILNINQN